MNYKLIFIALLILLITSSGYAITDTNLVAWYKLNDTNTTMLDAYGNNNGVNANMTLGQTGIIGTDYNFNGTTSDANAGNESNFDFLTTYSAGRQFTVSAWYKSTDSTMPDGINVIWSKITNIPVTGSVGTIAYVSSSAGALRIVTYKDNSNYRIYTTGNTNIQNGSWHHFVVTQTNGYTTIKVYLDGIELSTTQTNVGTPSTVNNNSPFRIGRGVFAADYKSKSAIDEVAIFNVDLNAQDINSLYNSGVGLTYPFTPTAIITSDFNTLTIISTTTLNLINNSRIDANWTIVDWNWLVNNSVTGIADPDANNTSYTPIIQNLDYNVCLSVGGQQDSNTSNKIYSTACKRIVAWDTISPTIIADINYNIGFVTDFNINYSLQCFDNGSPITYQIIKNDTNYLYNSLDANASIKTGTLTLASGQNARLTFKCIDLIGNTATYTTEYVYAILFRLINEANGTNITATQIGTEYNIARVYTPDGNYSFNFKDANTVSKNFFSNSKELYFEFGYKDTSQTIINRQIDFSLIQDSNIGLCVPLFQTFYQQRFVSNAPRAMVLQNNISSCYIIATTLSYVYDTGYSITTYTIPKPYFLYIWIDGVKTFLALIDGAVATQYNLDAIAFSRSAFDITVGQDTVGFAPLINTVTNKYDTNTIQIYYKSYLENNTQTNFNIKNGSTSVWNYTEYTSADEFLVNFYWGGLGINDQNVLELIITTTNTSGETTSKSYYFTTMGNYYPNEGANGWVVIVSTLFFLFGITLVASSRAFGIFGIIICLICLAITATASGAWWISLIQGIFLMCLIYIVMMGRNTAGNFA